MLKEYVRMKLVMKLCGFVYIYICNWSATSCIGEKLSLCEREYEYTDVYANARRIVKHLKC